MTRPPMPTEEESTFMLLIQLRAMMATNRYLIVAAGAVTLFNAIYLLIHGAVRLWL